MAEHTYDVIVLGGGPAGLAAAIEATKQGARALLVERERKLGGILKQCVHDGFGLLYFKERLTGPEYAQRFLDEFHEMNIDFILNSFVTDVHKEEDGFTILVQSAEGMRYYTAAALVLACGCRERTSRQVFIHGDRPAGIFTAGTAQYFTNIMGQMPTKRCVILGSGDIGMIMARRFTLEGASVEGVYEIKDAPAGLARNVSQCLNDFGIPLHLSSTVTQVYGKKRVEAVEVAQVDADFNPLDETRRRVDCDALILSVGLLPENEIAEMLGVKLDGATKGPIVDQSLMTSVPGVFSCGNALHVNDLVDWVTRSAQTAGRGAASYSRANQHKMPQGDKIKIEYDKNDFLYVVPQYFDPEQTEPLLLYFRSREDVRNKRVKLLFDGNEAIRKKYMRILPSEMEVLSLKKEMTVSGKIQLQMEDANLDVRQ